MHVVPCSSCVRRKCADLCPDGVKPSRRSYVTCSPTRDPRSYTDLLRQKDEAEFERLKSKIDSLEGALNTKDRRSRSPSRRQSTAYDDNGSMRPSLSPRSPFPHWSFANSLSQSTRIPTPPSYRYQETRSPIRPLPDVSRTDTMPSSELNLPGPGPHVGPSASTETSMFRGPEPSPNEQSHGTLVIDKTGRSRYFGATAGTEWLKNVSLFYDTSQPVEMLM